MAGKILYQGGDIVGKKKNSNTVPQTGTSAQRTTNTVMGASVPAAIHQVATPKETTPTVTPVSKAKSTPVTYTIDGKAKTGYVDENGVTYTDPNHSTRVPYGSIVYAGGSSYQMTDAGGVPTPQAQINDYDKQSALYMNAYAAAHEAQQKQIDANVTAAINRLSAQKRDVEQQKREADRVAYNTYLRAVNPYGANAQQMASLGLGNSGYSETNLASLGNQHQEAVNQAILARDKALRDIELQIEEARLSGDEQKAAAIAAYAQNYANMGLSLAQARAAIAQSAANAAYTQERDRISDARYAEETAYNREQNLFDKYVALVEGGLFPDDAAKVLGISQTQIDALKSYYARQIQ